MICDANAYFDAATQVLDFHSIVRENHIHTHLLDGLQLLSHGAAALRRVEIERNAVSVDDSLDAERNEREELGTQEICQSVGL